MGAQVRGRSGHLGARPRTLVCAILRGIETLVVTMNSCEVKCEYMTLYGQGGSGADSQSKLQAAVAADPEVK